MTTGPAQRAPAATAVAVRRLVRVRDGEPAAPRDDVVTVEEPLEIRLGETAIAVVMRTPGEDFELVGGFLLTEGIVTGPGDLGALSYCPSASPPNERNIVEVKLAQGVGFDPEALRRSFYATSSCGVCGKASIDQVRLKAQRQPRDFAVPAAVLQTLPQRLREAQAHFERTGSLHAAGLFDGQGRLLALREDVGRHNAVDKLVGSSVLQGQWPPADAVMMVSGRASFEIVQKALLAGLGFVACVSGPSSLAVDLAAESGMTLVGFLREGGYNVYAHPQRIAG